MKCEKCGKDFEGTKKFCDECDENENNPFFDAVVEKESIFSKGRALSHYIFFAALGVIFIMLLAGIIKRNFLYMVLVWVPVVSAVSQFAMIVSVYINKKNFVAARYALIFFVVNAAILVSSIILKAGIITPICALICSVCLILTLVIFDRKHLAEQLSFKKREG